MNRYKTEPEYILEESGKMRPMAKQLDCLSQTLLAVEVDLVVLSKEVSKLVNFLDATIVQVRGLRLSESELL